MTFPPLYVIDDPMSPGTARRCTLTSSRSNLPPAVPPGNAAPTSSCGTMFTAGPSAAAHRRVERLELRSQAAPVDEGGRVGRSRLGEHLGQVPPQRTDGGERSFALDKWRLRVRSALRARRTRSRTTARASASASSAIVLRTHSGRSKKDGHTQESRQRMEQKDGHFHFTRWFPNGGLCVG